MPLAKISRFLCLPQPCFLLEFRSQRTCARLFWWRRCWQICVSLLRMMIVMMVVGQRNCCRRWITIVIEIAWSATIDIAAAVIVVIIGNYVIVVVVVIMVDIIEMMGGNIFEIIGGRWTFYWRWHRRHFGSKR